jgi:predicted enzyme related to lactoylglutathione lyase
MQTIWVELPASDLERAIAFYAEVFGHVPGDIINQGVRRIIILPGAPSVALNQTAGFTPTIEPAEQRGKNGFFALIADSEGNGVTIHSAQA